MGRYAGKQQGEYPYVAELEGTKKEWVVWAKNLNAATKKHAGVTDAGTVTVRRATHEDVERLEAWR